jgi:hypothetical protein
MKPAIKNPREQSLFQYVGNFSNENQTQTSKDLKGIQTIRRLH